MQQIIKSHNSKIINENKNNDVKKPCNCKVKATCPLDGKCVVNDVIYMAKVSSTNETACYIGLASGLFKFRYNNHNKSFRHERYEKDTQLSKYIWELKRKNTHFAIKYEILKKCNTIRRASGQCNLCMEEKIQILYKRRDKSIHLINKRSEFISKCRHNNNARKLPTRAKKK